MEEATRMVKERTTLVLSSPGLLRMMRNSPMNKLTTIKHSRIETRRRGDMAWLIYAAAGGLSKCSDGVTNFIPG